MKKSFLFAATSILILASCSKSPDFADVAQKTSTPQEEINANAQKIFGITFDSNHDWCTTTSGQVTFSGIPAGTTKIQLYALIATEVKDDENQDAAVTSLLKLNEDAAISGSQVTLVYDAPSLNNGIYAAIECDGKRFMKLVNNGNANFANAKRTAARRAPSTVDFESMTLTDEVESFASQRGWLPGQKLYGMSDDAYESWKTGDEGYSDEFTQVFRNIVFSYLKNGKQYNNLPLIKESGYFNESAYPVTTGTGNIVVSPVYKCDGADKWGNEVWNSDLYYYYFKQADLDNYVAGGGTAADYLNTLPKFKAIPFNQHFGEAEDDNIQKRSSYTLIYWGDGTPELGTKGQPFPAGYKIGFMVRAKTDFVEDGKPRKQGELYCDGRLNNQINNYSECYFKSSLRWSNNMMKTDGPRAGWFNLEDRLFLCFESGTDADFNDIILEVEGGIEPIMFIPEFERDFYTFCFEDRELGDYDMNDIVIKATRINKTTVEYSIVACGAHDKLQIKNINGTTINGDKEIHSLFGVPTSTFINTVKGEQVYDAVTERITVDKDFSFLDEDTQPYIYNISQGKDIKISKKGEDPHGIMIPYDFKYPWEKICIKNAYGRFNEWGENRVNSTDWYKYYTQGKVYIVE
jgi:hypothetical protein